MSDEDSYEFKTLRIPVIEVDEEHEKFVDDFMKESAAPTQTEKIKLTNKEEVEEEAHPILQRQLHLGGAVLKAISHYYPSEKFAWMTDISDEFKEHVIREIQSNLRGRWLEKSAPGESIFFFGKKYPVRMIEPMDANEAQSWFVSLDECDDDESPCITIEYDFANQRWVASYYGPMFKNNIYSSGLTATDAIQSIETSFKLFYESITELMSADE